MSHDPVADAAAALHYDSYARLPDGAMLPQTTSQDGIVRMCRMLELEPGMRVLEIGTGSGYTGALLGRLVGDQGSVVSLDVDSGLVERARTKHIQHGIGNVVVHGGDGYAGWAPGAPYDRIIGWTTPHLVPRRWVEQSADQAVIVTPVEVAPIARAHMLLTVDLHHGQPVARNVCPGGFIEMHTEVITEVSVPIRHRDALYQTDGRGTVWISAPALRNDPGNALHAAEMIASGRSIPNPLGDDHMTSGAFYGYLYARQPPGLASTGFSGAGPASASGTGLVLIDSAAVLRVQDMFVAGTRHAEESLRCLFAEWDQDGRPDHSSLRPHLILDPHGFRVGVEF